MEPGREVTGVGISMSFSHHYVYKVDLFYFLESPEWARKDFWQAIFLKALCAYLEHLFSWLGFDELFRKFIFLHFQHLSSISYKYFGEGNGPHSSSLAWKIPWMEEPSGLQSMGLLRVRHDWANSLSLFSFMHWRRKWQPTPVFLPGESQGWRSLVGCRLWGRTESATTEAT